MPVAVERLATLILVRFTGELTATDLSEAAEGLDAIDRATPGVSRLVDATEVSNTSLDFTAIARFAEDRRGWSLARQVKTAVLVTTPAVFGLARMFALMLEHPEIAIEVFHDRRAALEWIGVSEDDASRLPRPDRNSSARPPV
jgi:hypothetical protein